MFSRYFKYQKENKEPEFAMVAIPSGNVTATFYVVLAMDVLTCIHLNNEIQIEKINNLLTEKC